MMITGKEQAITRIQSLRDNGTVPKIAKNINIKVTLKEWNVQNDAMEEDTEENSNDQIWVSENADT